MSEPLTDYERELNRERSQHIVDYPNSHFIRILNETAARLNLRYEATLQAKDDTIAALVDGILATKQWEREGRTFCCVLCREAWPRHKKTCMRFVAAAIKEATDAS